MNSPKLRARWLLSAKKYLHKDVNTILDENEAGKGSFLIFTHFCNSIMQSAAFASPDKRPDSQ